MIIMIHFSKKLQILKNQIVKVTDTSRYINIEIFC
jgi:hypothetical protein